MRFNNTSPRIDHPSVNGLTKKPRQERRVQVHQHRQGARRRRREPQRANRRAHQPIHLRLKPLLLRVFRPIRNRNPRLQARIRRKGGNDALQRANSSATSSARALKQPVPSPRSLRNSSPGLRISESTLARISLLNMGLPLAPRQGIGLRARCFHSYVRGEHESLRCRTRLRMIIGRRGLLR